MIPQAPTVNNGVVVAVLSLAFVILANLAALIWYAALLSARLAGLTETVSGRGGHGERIQTLENGEAAHGERLASLEAAQRQRRQ